MKKSTKLSAKNDGKRLHNEIIITCIMPFSLYQVAVGFFLFFSARQYSVIVLLFVVWSAR